MREYLFIYGTLLPGCGAGEMADSISRLNYVGQAFVRGRLYDLGKYPGAVLDPSSQMTVCGRVYELPGDPAMLRALDLYEEFDLNHSDDCLFVRKQTTALLDNGRSVQCWIYTYNRNPDTAPLISDGDYKKYQAA